MLFSEILGLSHLKSHLTGSADRKRIPHAQLFAGANGSGTLLMAIAYAQYILCQNTHAENNTGKQACNLKFDKLAHPDLHFAFPVAINNRVKSHPVSSHFMEEWRAFVKETPYGSLFDWYQRLGIENKQGQIGVDEAQDITKTLSLKAYEGGFKVMIIWQAEKMNNAAANKLLKLIEEPPQQTLFILITENEEQLLQTIRSRCQVLHFPPLSERNIEEGLTRHYNCNIEKVKKIATRSEGNFAKALQILHEDESELQFESWFISWVRTAFRAKGNKSAIRELLQWSEEISATGRETQKKFLLYCQNFFRQALLQNYRAESLVFFKPGIQNFDLKKFAPFIHGGNIERLYQELETAIFHIERNANAKIVLTDLSIKLTRLLHAKP